MSYVDEVMEQVVATNPAQPEFHQAVKEVLESLRVVVEANEEAYRKEALLERLVIPDRQILFRVSWVDDNGQVRVNNGYRVQFNSAIGPYKGGLRLHPSVNLGIIKFLGFEQIFKNSLTGLPIGGGKGGSAEGANMPTTSEAIDYLQANGILFCPGKAANAGGVATSALEMSQNSERLSWTFEEVDRRLQEIMVNIFHSIDTAAEKYGKDGDYVAGANIAGFLKVAEAMMACGVI